MEWSKRKACSGSFGISRSLRAWMRFSGQTEGGLEEIERKRQKRSQKLQSWRERQRNHLKNARDCEEVQMLNKEMEESKALYETRFRALSEKSGDCRKAAAELDNEIQALQAGEETKDSSASQSNGCCFDPTIWEQVFAFGETRTASFIQFMQQEFCQALQNSRRSRSSGLEVKRKESGKETG